MNDSHLDTDALRIPLSEHEAAMRRAMEHRLEIEDYALKSYGALCDRLREVEAERDAAAQDADRRSCQGGWRLAQERAVKVVHLQEELRTLASERDRLRLGLRDLHWMASQHTGPFAEAVCRRVAEALTEATHDASTATHG